MASSKRSSNRIWVPIILLILAALACNLSTGDEDQGGTTPGTQVSDGSAPSVIIQAPSDGADALINADVRPIVAAARLEKNLPVDPVIAYVESGYQQKIEDERK